MPDVVAGAVPANVRDPSQPNSTSDRLLTAAQLKARWGDCSDMLLWRRLHDDPAMPRPLRMRGRRLWWLSEIVAYERFLAKRDEE
jgi:hypothetical protein